MTISISIALKFQRISAYSCYKVKDVFMTMAVYKKPKIKQKPTSCITNKGKDGQTSAR